MLKQTITFKDFNDQERTETLYFNFTEAELVDIQADSDEGIQKEMEDAVKAKDLRKLLDFIKMLISKSYGEPDRDGIHFNKSPEITQRFINSAMYSPLLLSLFQDEGARAEKFITGLMPADLVRRALAQANGGGTQVSPEVPQVAPSAREVFAQRQQERNVPEAEPISLADSTLPQFSDQPAPAYSPAPESAPVAEPFSVSETPLSPSGEPEDITRREARERAEFEAWKAQQNTQA